MSGLLYDAGALIAAEANRRDVWALHLRGLQRGLRPRVPSVVLAQAWRGGPQAQLSRFLRGCDVVPFHEEGARSVGAALKRAKRQDIVDAAVVVIGAARDDLVVTSDPDDILAIASALGVRLRVHPL